MRSIRMTRRKVLFRDTENTCCWVTPEFNGDRSELREKGSRDSCDKDWQEIFEEFKNVKTLPEFEKMNAQAQKYYHSHLPGTKILPVENIGNERFEENDSVIEELNAG
jgi:hypothetical protein